MKIKDGKFDLLNRGLYMSAVNYTTVERDALVDVAAGAFIYNTTDGELNVYNGSSWDSLVPNSQAGLGSTAQRPGAPGAGELYYDTDIDKLIVYTEGGWKDYDGNNV